MTHEELDALLRRRGIFGPDADTAIESARSHWDSLRKEHLIPLFGTDAVRVVVAILDDALVAK